MKELRENAERIVDIQTSLKEQVQEEQSYWNVNATLSDASATNLICELLPMLSKSHPAIATKAIRELVEMPWKSQSGIDEAEVSDEEMENSIQESAILHDGLVPLSTSSVRLSGTRGVSTKAVTPSALVGTNTPDGMAEEEEDQIQDWD